MTKYRFDQIADNIRIPVMPKSEDSERYIGLEHMDSGSLRVSRWGTKVDLIGQKLTMKKGDVLFARRNAYIRRVAVAPFDGIFSAHGMVLRAKPEVCLQEFLPVFMESDYFMERAIRISAGSLSPTINWSSLNREEFEIPPVDEQRRIADLLWAADDAISQYQEVENKLKQLWISAASYYFSKTDGQKEYRLGDLLEYGSDGPFGSKLKTEHYTDKGVRVVRLQNIQENYFDDNDTAYISSEYYQRELVRYTVNSGDVLVAGLVVCSISNLT